MSDGLVKHKNTQIFTSPTSLLTTEEKGKIIMNDADRLQREYDAAHANLLSKFEEAKNVEAPHVILPGSQILVTAMPPITERKTVSGIILGEELEGSQREINRLKNSTENVIDFQRVLIVGLGAQNYFGDKLKEGDFVKINFSRYRSLADGSMDGRVATTYNIPTTVIEDKTYMILDYLDIFYIQKAEYVDPKFK